MNYCGTKCKSNRYGEVHQELKRLQKEIDEAQTRRDSILYGSETDNFEWDTLKNIIETNQQRIKEIIESL